MCVREMHFSVETRIIGIVFISTRITPERNIWKKIVINRKHLFLKKI